MPPVKVFCRACQEDHPRPVGRNCKRQQQVGDAAVTVGQTVGPSQPSVSVQSTANAATDVAVSDVNMHILSALKTNWYLWMGGSV